MLMTSKSALDLAGLALSVLRKPNGKPFGQPKKATDSLLGLKIDVFRMSSGKPLSGSERSTNRLGAADEQPSHVKTVTLTEDGGTIVVYNDGTEVLF